MALIITRASVTTDIPGEFVFDRLGQYLLGSLPQEVCQNMPRPNWRISVFHVVYPFLDFKMFLQLQE